MLHKRLDNGCNGYGVPFVPKAARSSRKRGHVKTEMEDNQMCAFDLLASVAGTLLLEGESCEDGCSVEDKSLIHEDVVMNERCEGKKLEYCEQGNVDVPPPSLSLGLDDYVGCCTLKDFPGSQHDLSLVPPSFITMLDCFKKNSSLDKMDLNSQSGLCGHSRKQVIQLENRLPVMNDSIEQHDCGPELTLHIGPDMPGSEDPNFFDRKPHALATCDNVVKQSVGNDHYPRGLLSFAGGSNVKLVRKDDDENLSECAHPRTMKTNRSLARIGDRRIRKLLASKYWGVASNLKDTDHTDNEMHCVYRSRKMGFKRQRSQRIYPFKKRKLYNYRSVSIPDEDFRSKGAYNSCEKAGDTNASGFGAVGYGVDGPASRVASQSITLPSRESHVKLRIRSFRVPEFFIEMPETATIGSLKRAVMETVTALLGGGLHVGVVLHGKKIRDDSRTLLQSGICHDDKLDSLGFTLEPNPTQTCQPVCSQDKALPLSANVTEPLSRFPGFGTFHLATSQVSSDHPGPVPNLGNLIESDHDSTPLPAEISTDKGTVGSQALLAVPNGTPQALAAVPANQKSKQSDICQRRSRKPFSVAEVEALVQAVEMLGTGRWRDVKLKAFDDVKHRTYVDLKDKWKTLVHTARIAPQQRRGQPVPQELLDRVLAAHAYWSQHQTKQQLKQPSDAGLP